jgi:hypothetical protein
MAHAFPDQATRNATRAARTGSGGLYHSTPAGRVGTTSVQYDGVDGWAALRSHCPVCLAELAQVPADEAALHRLRHAAAEDDLRCPLTTQSYQPEEMVVHQMRNPVLEGRQRAAFIGNWTRHYRVMKRLAPSFTVHRLTLLVRYADVLNLWSYPAIRQHDLPYVLLVLAGFIRDQGPQGDTIWVRFCFDGNVHDVGDLWRDGGSPPQLFRMVYRPPFETPFPTSRELTHFQMVGRDAGFLDGPDPTIRSAEAREFHRFLSMALVQGAL